MNKKNLSLSGERKQKISVNNKSSFLKRYSVLLFVVIGYCVVYIFKSSVFKKVINTNISIILSLLPSLVFVYILMFATNYFINDKKIIKSINSVSKLKKYSLSVVLGIISSGPIYVWYGLLASLRKSGLSYSLISVFLYNRAVKLPLLPLLVAYFGLKFTVILTVVMVVASLVQGELIHKLLD